MIERKEIHSGIEKLEGASINKPEGWEKDLSEPEHTDTVVIGGGQAGLSVGYHLSKKGVPFIILDASKRIGDSWRERWDSLRLFTPARYDGLDGMPFPASAHSFPTKDEMADYLQSYAKRFKLSVRSGIRVDGLSRVGERFLITAGEKRFEANHVVVAMSDYQRPKVPVFAKELDPAIVQLHSCEYRNLSQLRDGAVLIAGAGNSGSEIAMEVSRKHSVWMSGRDTGHLPFRIASKAGRHILVPLVLKFIFHRVLTIRTFIGRKARPNLVGVGGPLIRVMPKDLASAGVKRIPKVIGVKDGMPLLEDQQVLNVTNVIWCTGFHPGFSWIDLPIFEKSEPIHRGGVIPSIPGIYFCGLHFLYAMSSGMVHGVGRDAKRIVDTIAQRARKMKVRAA
jgi:putative flavoprotein involved in K+ transport